MRRLSKLLLLSAGLLSQAASAWDTRVEVGYPTESWLSLYQAGKDISIPEHTRLSDLAFRELGVFDLFGRKGTAKLLLVDLNASEFRERELLGSPKHGDKEKTLLEERLIPPPALFAGVPDYSYTIYDWLNKNRLCPALPGSGANAADRCHVFALGWLGDLNSIHFGSQAQKMYAQYHFIALRHASWAASLRTRIRSHGEANREYWSATVKEAELLALAYEGYAQHFLQDRWAIGHMWERWSAPNYAQLPSTGRAENHFVSAVAGLLHGSEAVVGPHADNHGFINAADPMSSPVVHDDVAIPMQWVHESASKAANRGPHPGVGDERLADLQAGYFGVQYPAIGKDYPIHVDLQKREMLECSKAGWAEVIRKFGKRDGTYGEWKANLSASAPKFDVVKRQTCWDQWATNESIYTGLVGDQAQGALLSASILGRLIPTTLTEISSELAGQNLGGIRETMVGTYFTIWRQARKDPTGINLAKGDIGYLQGFKTGDHYDLPDYAEPLTREDLANVHSQGKDRETVFGVFNRAGADHWCNQASVYLGRLREQAEDRPRKAAACEYLASMMYQGTNKDYDGARKETRQDDQGREIKSICLIHDIDEYAGQDSSPIWLDPGYVAEPQELADGPDNYGYQSIRNWCAKVPVLELDFGPKEAKANVVAYANAETTELTLRGYNLGDERGELVIHPGEDGEPAGWSIQDWNDQRITLNLTAKEWRDGDYLITLKTAEGKESVGLFRLRIDSGPKEDIVEESEPLIFSGNWPCGPAPKQTIERITIGERWAANDDPLDYESVDAIIELATPSLDLIEKTFMEQAACIRKIKTAGWLPLQKEISASRGGRSHISPPYVMYSSGYLFSPVIDWTTGEIQSAPTILNNLYDFEMELEAFVGKANELRYHLHRERDNMHFLERFNAMYVERYGATPRELADRYMAGDFGNADAPGDSGFGMLPDDMPSDATNAGVPNPDFVPESETAEGLNLLGDADTDFEFDDRPSAEEQKRIIERQRKQHIADRFTQLNERLEALLVELPRWRALDRYARTLGPIIRDVEPERQRLSNELRALYDDMSEVGERIQALLDAKADMSVLDPLYAQLGQLGKEAGRYEPCFTEPLLTGVSDVTGYGPGPSPFNSLLFNAPDPLALGLLIPVVGHGNYRIEDGYWEALQSGLQLPAWANHECEFWLAWYSGHVAPSIGTLAPDIEPTGADYCQQCAELTAAPRQSYAELRELRGNPKLPEENSNFVTDLGRRRVVMQSLQRDSAKYQICLNECRNLPVSDDLRHLANMQVSESRQPTGGLIPPGGIGAPPTFTPPPVFNPPPMPTFEPPPIIDIPLGLPDPADEPE